MDTYLQGPESDFIPFIMDKTAMAVAVFDEHARLYQDKYMDQHAYGATLDLFCHHLPQQDAAVLDVACGPGNISRYLLAQRPELHMLGIDLSPNMLRLARENNPQADYKLLDCRHIDRLDMQFAGIVCGFVLPYLSREEALQLITNASSLLLPGGVLYISTMEDAYSKSGMQTSSSGSQLYQYFHEAAYLIPALEASGYTLILQHRQPFPAHPATTDLILIARKPL